MTQDNTGEANEADRLAEQIKKLMFDAEPGTGWLAKASHLVAQLAALAKQQAPEATKALCMCKDRAASACPGEWEPG